MEMSVANMRAESGVLAVARAAEESPSAIAWGAILGGAVAATALSLILLALGSGLGLSAISPFSYEGASASTLGFGAIVWLIAMSAAASGLGGYISGRLRSKWSDVDADEAFFRDTAHGFLAWAVATVISAAVLTSAAATMVGAAATTAATAGVAGAAGVAATAPTMTAGSNVRGDEVIDTYFVDMLFRTSRPSEAATDTNSVRQEAASIIAHATRQGDLSAGDKGYLEELVARRTGLAPSDAEQRVAKSIEAARLAADATAAKARAVAEAARQASARLALWIFISLLIGAFCAAFAATIGGRQRDPLAGRRHAH